MNIPVPIRNSKPHSTDYDTGQWIIVVGAGGHGSEIVSYLNELTAGGKNVHLVGLVDEHKPAGLWGTAEIIGDFSALESFVGQYTDTVFQYITAVGDNRTRLQLVQKIEGLGAQNLRPWTLSHPRASVGQGVEVGLGTCLAPGSILTTRVRVGKHCVLNVNVSISHDCLVGDFVNLNPGAVICGNVRLGDGCYVGAGATVIDKVSIGEWSIIGAGAVVIDNLPAHVTAVGVPARVIKRHNP